jgi:hypothetical protein
MPFQRDGVSIPYHMKIRRHNSQVIKYGNLGALKDSRYTTWFAKPTPTPRRTRPNISMYRLVAAPLRAEPERNAAPPARIDGLRPKYRVIDEAKKEATRPAT